MTLGTAAGTAAVLDAQSDPTTTTIASQFLDAWDKAWAGHDAHALGELHTSNAVTINRFGTLLKGRAPTERALGFLHSKEGPFGHSTFPPMQLLEARSVASEVILVNAGWKNPVMHLDGKSPRPSGAICWSRSSWYAKARRGVPQRLMPTMLRR